MRVTNPPAVSLSQIVVDSGIDFSGGDYDILMRAGNTVDGQDISEADPAGLFGSGVDGDHVVNIDENAIASMFYDNLTVDAGETLTLAGWIVFVRDTLTLNGTISAEGNAGATGGAGGAGGAALVANDVGGSGVGGNGSGANGGGGGGSGGGICLVVAKHVIFGANGLITADGGVGGAGHDGAAGVTADGNAGGAIGDSAGDDGGNGGSGGVSTGGVGGIATQIAALELAFPTLKQLIRRLTNNAIIDGGAGGGGGSCVNAAEHCGGGGGGGGYAVLMYKTETGYTAVKLTAAGGVGGAGGFGAGDPGDNGVDGNARLISLG